MLEIYNEQIFDLLSTSDSRTPCALRQKPSGAVSVAGLTIKTVETGGQLCDLVIAAARRRGRLITAFLQYSSQPWGLPRAMSTAVAATLYSSIVLQENAQLSRPRLAASSTS